MTTLPVPSPTAEELLPRILDDLRACLCAQVDDTCFCGIVSGPQIVADRCGCNETGCGQAWVRLARVFPASVDVGTPDTKASCDTVLSAVIEVGVYRCQPTPSSTTGVVDAAAATDAAIVTAQDSMKMFRAIRCCEAITSRKHRLGTWEPRGTGGCAGGIVTVTVRLSRR